jgi:ABC-type bacteriocin/lantibiotic exporter with double-glycine peptidase domain
LASNILVKLSRNCIQQISRELVGSVFNLVLLLLLRCDVCQDVQLSRATLITVGIVSGHLSGRINELIDLSQSSDINDIYSLYADLVSETAERGL